jgi:FKBP-type peptidyl-prolyl cis-trans isomerase FklB
MKLKLQKMAVLIAFLASFSAMAEELTPTTIPSGPPDKEKVSYALGMQMGMEIKPSGAKMDADVLAQAIKDVLEGKPTMFKESEIAEILTQAQKDGLAVATMTVKGRDKFSYALGMRKGLQLKLTGADIDTGAIGQGLKDMLEGKPTKIQESEIEPLFKQAQAYGLAQLSKKNSVAGEAFLAKNAGVQGVKMLPDGLQYKVIVEGTGEKPTTEDLLFIKYRGSFIDGTVFDRKEHYLTRSTGGLPGWQDAMQRMKVGSKWQIFVPPALGFGHRGEAVLKVGPDAVLIYELELLSIAKPGDPQIGTGRVGHGLDGESSPNSEK